VRCSDLQMHDGWIMGVYEDRVTLWPTLCAILLPATLVRNTFSRAPRFASAFLGL
jgi:hypothetical protein